MKKFVLLLLSAQCSVYNISLAQNPGDLVGYTTMQNQPWFDVTVQPDGKVLVYNGNIARYNTDGSLDNTFGNNGLVPPQITDTILGCNAIVIQPDGKILVAGTAANGNLGPDFLLVRYNADGSRDSTFDGDGMIKADFNSGSEDYGYKIAIQPDGKIIVAGESDEKLVLNRYHSNGVIDSTFDYDGKLIAYNIGVNNYSSYQGRGQAAYMALQTDGKILVGSTDSLVRLNTDGSADSSFGINGIVPLPEAMNDLAIRPDGKVVLAGRNLVILRLDTNGVLDSTFNAGMNGSYDWSQVGCNNLHQIATSVALQPDGKILAGGTTICGTMADWRGFAVVRLHENGGLDSSFGSDGIVTTVIFQSSFESHASVITPGMEIVLVGYEYWWEYGVLAKYLLGGMQWPADAKTIAGNNETFIIAPNPTTSKLTITSGNKIKELSICNAMGQIAERQVLSGSEQVTVDVAHLSPGIYYIKLTGENGSTRTGKFLKQ